MNQNTPKPTLCSRVAYKNLRGAVDWLEKALGFDITTLATDAEGKVVHAELAFGNGVIEIGSEWENIKAPGSLGGANTQTITVHVEGGVDQHCERARAAGGTIIQEPTDQFHGDRTCRIMDREGHVWSLSEKLREVTVEEMEAAIPGMKVRRR